MRASAWIVAVSTIASSVAHAQDVGELVIMTTPSGAEVFVDGKSAGRSPAQAQLLPGDHVVQVKWDDGQQSTETVVAVELGKSNLASFKSSAAIDAAPAPMQTRTGLAPAVAPAIVATLGAPPVSAAAVEPVTTSAAVNKPPNEGKIWLGGDLEILPSGSITESQGSNSTSISPVTALGLGASLEYRVSPLISIGIAPRYVLNVKSAVDTDSASMLDIRTRISFGYEVAPHVRVYGTGALGYAMIFLPATAGAMPTPTGLTLTFGGGATYALNPRMRIGAELGYELGFESSSEMGGSASLNLNYLHLSGGIAIALGH